MRSILRLLLLPGLLGGLFGGCSEKIEPKPVTYSQLLTGTEKKTWRLVSIQVFDQGQGSGVIPASEVSDPCVIDDLYTFYANAERKFEITEGASKCDPADADVFVSDQWTLINANATLEFTFPLLANQRLPYTVKNLTDRVLTVELYLQNLADLDASYRLTFNAVTTK